MKKGVRRIIAGAVATLLLGIAIWWFVTREPAPEGLIDRISMPHGRAVCAVFDSGGRCFVGGSLGDVFVFSDSGSHLTTISSGNNTAIVSIDISADGQLIASHWNGETSGWEPVTDGSDLKFKDVRTTPFSASKVGIRPGPVASLSLAITEGDLSILESGAQPFDKRIKMPEGERITALAWSPKGDQLAVGTNKGRLLVFSGAKREEVHNQEVAEVEIAALTWSTDSKQLAVGDLEGGFVVWNVSTWKRDAILRQPDSVTAIAITESGYVTGSWDGRLRFWKPGADRPHAQADTRSPIVFVFARPDAVWTIDGEGRLSRWKSR